MNLKLTDEQIETARRQIRSGEASKAQLARRFGVAPSTIKRALNPAYREAELEKRRARGYRSVEKKCAADRTFLRLVEEIPKYEHPDLTGRIMGDPNPNDMRRATMRKLQEAGDDC